MRRVVIAGIPGAGKSTLAASIARACGLPYVELDGLVEGPGWVVLPDHRERVVTLADTPEWVVDGLLYPPDVADLLLARCDTVVWLDLSRAVVVRRLVRRTLHRGLPPRPVLVNGNRERLWAVLLTSSPLRTAWRDHAPYRARTGELLAATSATVVRLRTPQDVRGWVSRTLVGTSREARLASTRDHGTPTAGETR